jgi:hypothetical protein
MVRVRPLAALTLVLSLLAAAAPASAATFPDWNLSVKFTMPSQPGTVYSQSAGNCLIFTGGWSVDSTQRFAGSAERPRGHIDLAARSGELIVPGEGIHVDRIFGPRPQASAARDVGIQLAGRRAYLTGTIGSARSHSARAARRVRLAQLHGPAVATKVVRGVPVASVRGRVTMLPPLVSLLNRLRCKGPRVDEHPIPANAPLGTVTATFVPGRATAAVNSFGFAFSLAGTAYGPEPPRVEPTGGAQGDADALTLAAAPASRVTMRCDPQGCAATDGHLALAGGFDFVDGARRLPVTSVTLDLANERATIGGSVGGTQIALAAPEPSGDQRLLTISGPLRAQLVATFGDAELGGFVRGLQLAFGELTPA